MTRKAVLGTLFVLLLFVIATGVSLLAIGTFATYGAIYLATCAFVTFLPLLVAAFLLFRCRFRFGLQSMMVTVALVAVFLFVAFLPLWDYESSRSVSSQLTAAGSLLDELMDLDRYYLDHHLEPSPHPEIPSESQLFPWLKPFAAKLSLLPPDVAIRSVYLTSDRQVRILCDNAKRLKNLQGIHVNVVVSGIGLDRLAGTFENFPNLDIVILQYVNPPENWYKSLGGIRTLNIWLQGQKKGKLTPESIASLSSLQNLEVLFVHGNHIDDSDVKILATSPSLKTLVLKCTQVTEDGALEYRETNPAGRLYLK